MTCLLRHRRTARPGRRVVLLASRVLAVIGLVALLITVPAGSASASVFDGCKSAPSPEGPGNGLLGDIDPQPAPNIDGSQYGAYGYAGLHWVTYDLGCAGAVQDPGATADTWVGNALFTGAKALTALDGRLHLIVRQPGVLAGLDPIVGAGTKAVGDAFTRPWLPVALLILGCLLLVKANRQDLPAVIKATGWALIVMTAATGLLSYPVRASHVMDSTLISATNSITDKMDSIGLPRGGTYNTDPAIRHNEILVDKILVTNWRRGEFGSDTTAAATTDGDTLLHDQAFSRTDYATYKAKLRACYTKGTFYRCWRVRFTPGIQGEKWVKTADAIHAMDPQAYASLTGHAGGRAGSGALAVFEAACATLFGATADLLLLAAMLILRICVFFFPALAVVGVVQSRWVLTVTKTASAAILNTIVFTLAAGFQSIAAIEILGPASGSTSTLIRIVILGIISWLMWIAFKPFRRLTAMVDPNHQLVALPERGSRTGRLGARIIGGLPGRRPRDGRAALPVAEVAADTAGPDRASSASVRGSRPEVLVPLATVSGDTTDSSPMKGSPRGSPAAATTAAPGAAPSPAGPSPIRWLPGAPAERPSRTATGSAGTLIDPSPGVHQPVTPGRARSRPHDRTVPPATAFLHRTTVSAADRPASPTAAAPSPAPRLSPLPTPASVSRRPRTTQILMPLTPGVAPVGSDPRVTGTTGQPAVTTDPAHPPPGTVESTSTAAAGVGAARYDPGAGRQAVSGDPHVTGGTTIATPTPTDPDRARFDIYDADHPAGLATRARSTAGADGRTVYRIYDPATGESEWVNVHPA